MSRLPTPSWLTTVASARMLSNRRDIAVSFLARYAATGGRAGKAIVSSVERSDRFEAKSISKPTTSPLASRSTFKPLAISRVSTRLGLQFDVEAVRLRIIVKLHGSSPRSRDRKRRCARFPIVERHHAQIARFAVARIDDRASHADAAIRLRKAAEGAARIGAIHAPEYRAACVTPARRNSALFSIRRIPPRSWVSFLRRAVENSIGRRSLPCAAARSA